MEIRHLISIEDVTVEWWNELYSTCKDIISHPGDYSDACRGKVMASLFFEPSTRTNFSFQTAMMRLWLCRSKGDIIIQRRDFGGHNQNGKRLCRYNCNA